MSMFRRRLISSINKGIDYLAGYRNNQLTTSYNLQSEWLSDKVVNLRHISNGYQGPSAAYKCFISKQADLFGSTGASAALGQTPKEPIPTFENGKTYKFTAKIININYNDITEATGGTLRMGCGNGTAYVWINETPFIGLGIGSELSFTFTIDTSKANTQVSAFYFGTSAPAKWSFNFEIDIKEIK